MLHIIGVLLKLIGIVLAVILGLLVLLICIVLFVPVQYEVKADFPGNPENISGYGKVSWLLHLFSVRFAYNEEKFTWKLRLGWKSFRDDSQIEEKPVKNKPKTRKQKAAKKKSVQVSKSRSEEKVDSKPDEKVNSQKPAEKVQSIAEGESKKAIQIKTEMKHLPDKSEVPEKPSVFERIFNKIKAIFEKIKYTFYQICDKIKVICETKEKITNFLENEVHRTAFAGAVKELVWLKRFLKPKKLKQIYILVLRILIIPDLRLRHAV